MIRKWMCAMVGTLCLQGCFSLTDKQLPAPPPIPTSATKAIADKSASHKHSQSLPKTLGGLIQSDSWVIYQEKQEEEFKGHVSYENDSYRFRADYALSQRTQNLFTAQGNVYLRKQDPDGTWYELYADKAVYNYKTGKGYALSQSKHPVRLYYHTAKGDLVHATAHRADLNTQLKTYQLTGHAVITHTNLQKQTNTLQADKISAKQMEQYALLEGNAEVSNDQYRLQANRIEYDGSKQYASALGDRPLATGTTENGTFAIIADEVQAQTNTRNIQLKGHVQGWLLSDQLNEAEKQKAHK